MTRLLLLCSLVLALLIPMPGWAAPTLRDFDENGGGAGATTVNSPAMTVVTGDLVIIACANNSSQSITSITGGGDTLTLLTENATSAQRHVQAYKVNSSANGSITYTCTFAASASSREIHVWVINPNGSTFDATPDASLATGLDPNSAAVNTGNITTTGSGDWVVVTSVYLDAGRTATLEANNGVTAANQLDPGGSMISWQTFHTSAFTNGAGTATLSAATRWTANIVAFQAASGGGGGPTCTGGLLLRGVGAC